ncbi:MAG: hypothetical protein AAB393_01670 [Bacteroidota bacterium]
MVRHKWLNVAIVLVVAMGIVAAGCKKDEETTSPRGGTTPTAPQAPTITNFGGVSPTNVLAVVRVSAEPPYQSLGFSLM